MYCLYSTMYISYHSRQPTLYSDSQERLRAEEAASLAYKQQRDAEHRRATALQQAMQSRDAALTEVRPVLYRSCCWKLLRM
jgi:hypothetical protein